MRQFCVVLVAIICVSGFVAFSAEAQNTKAVYGISVPDKLGKVKERYVGTTDSVIVHIQDAHANFEAQKNIANIIEFLVRKDDLRIVGSEGATSKVDTHAYRDTPFKEEMKAAALEYVRKGIFTGGEYAQIVSAKEFEFYGIEDEVLMLKNYKAFLEVSRVQESALQEFVALDAAVRALSVQILNEDLKSFLAVYENYEDEMIDFVDFSTELIVKAKDMKIDLFPYADLNQYVDYIEKKNEIDLDALEDEKDALIEIFEKRSGELDENQVYIKLQKALSGENRLYSLNEVESMLIVLAREFSVPEEQYQNLASNIEVERRFQLFNVGRLIREADELTYQILFLLAQTEDERALLTIRRMLNVIIKMGSFEALKNDVLHFTENRASIDVNEWYTFIEAQLGKASLDDVTLARGLVDVEEFFTNSALYYESAITRDTVLADNMVSLMTEKGKGLSAMICGGYHTEGITERLRETGQSYVVIMPRITTSMEEIPLKDRLTGALFGIDALEVINEDLQ